MEDCWFEYIWLPERALGVGIDALYSVGMPALLNTAVLGQTFDTNVRWFSSLLSIYFANFQITFYLIFRIQRNNDIRAIQLP